MNSDFFDYEKYISNVINNKENKIEIYNNPKKRYLRHKILDYKNYQYGVDKGGLKNIKIERRRGYSHGIKRDLMINETELKDDISTILPIYSNKNINRLALKSGKILYKFRKKKSYF